MAIRLTLELPGPDNAADLVTLLLATADRADRGGRGDAAAVWRGLADGIGDGLDALDAEPEPTPSPRKPMPQWVADDEVDELAVERVVRGDGPYPALTRAEALLASQRLTAAGASSAVIAERTGVARRTVHRWRPGGAA